jgi:hypothetical protein
MFIAATPAIVGKAVPGTTAGHQPSGSVRCHRSSIVTPGSTTAIPVAGSNERMRFIAVKSSAWPPRFTLASP